jgi:hypothetical protein
VKIYFAGVGNEKLVYPDRLPASYPVLESYAYLPLVKHQLRREHPDFFLDSGAFTAWSQGKEVDLEEYCDFILEHKDKVTCYAGLDVIGDYKATIKNVDRMIARGLMPIPTFHYGEPYFVLDEYKKFPYIAIGGIVRLARPSMYAFFDQAWNHLVDENGEAVTKVHGFGLTVDEAMLRYPWYSVDSTTWLNGGKFGIVLHPKHHRRLTMSDNSPYSKVIGKHVDTVSDIEREEFYAAFRERGFEPEELMRDYKLRNTWNMLRHMEWGESIKGTKHVNREGLF